MNIDIDFRSGVVSLGAVVVASPGLLNAQVECQFEKVGGVKVLQKRDTYFRLEKPLEWSGCKVDSCVVLCHGRQCSSVVINIDPIALYGDASKALCLIAKKMCASSSEECVESACAPIFKFDWGRALICFDAHYGAPTLTMEYMPGRLN